MKKNIWLSRFSLISKFCVLSAISFYLCDLSEANNSVLPEGLSRIVKSSNIPSSAISIIVQSLDNDEMIASVNTEVSRSPASLIKVVPTWVALETLGPEFTWKTEIYTTGPIEDGTLYGDLLIKGYGDPYFVIEDLWLMTGQLSRKGVKHIEGDILIDSSHFDSNELVVSSLDGEHGRLYNVSPSANMVNFKWIEFIINPSKDGKTTRITTIPALSNLRVLNSVKVSDKPCRGNNPNIRFRHIKDDNKHAVEISGTLPKSCKNYTLSRTALTPEAYLYGLFKLIFKQLGGSISGKYAKAKLEPSRRRVLFHSWESKPLSEIVLRLNKWSNNLMARTLVYSIGSEALGVPASKKKGIRAIKQYVSESGINVDNLHIDNGSGLSRSTRVTASLINEILKKAWKSQIMPEFVSSLSIAGKDGTTRKRFRRKSVENRIRLKTGTLKNVSSAGGYVFGKSGKTYSVVFIANHSNVERVTGPRLQEALMKWVSEL